MATKKISELTAGVTLADADEFAAVQSGATKKWTAAKINEYIDSEIDGLSAQTVLLDAMTMKLRNAGSSEKATFQTFRNFFLNTDYPSYKNLVIENNSGNPTYQVDVSWDNMRIGYIYAGSFSGTIDITNSGALGLDTGSEANSTWYYIWAIAQDDGTNSVMLSASATSPTMPGSYTQKRLIGAVRNDGSGDFLNFKQRNEQHIYDPYISIANTAASGETAVASGTVDTVFPQIESIEKFYLFVQCSGVVDQVVGFRCIAGASFAQSQVNNSVATTDNYSGEMPNIDRTIIMYKQTGGGTIYLTTSGFSFTL